MIMYVYIAYRNLREHYSQNAGFGGKPYNNDYSLSSINDGVYYLLCKNGAYYAVSKEAGEKFIEEVLSKCTGENPGFFPLEPSLNGKDTAAVVEATREVSLGSRSVTRNYYYDMDDEVLYGMMEELMASCGEPLDEVALMNYRYPKPAIPDGDLELKMIYHGIYCKPETVPAGVIRTFFPDTESSFIKINSSSAFLELRSGDTEMHYKVPDELIPDIKDKARQLCADPKDAYIEHGDPEGYIRFGKKDDRIFTDPDKTLELIKEIASKSIFEKSEEVDKKTYYTVRRNTAARICKTCGADVTGKNYCTECGTKAE